MSDNVRRLGMNLGLIILAGLCCWRFDTLSGLLPLLFLAYTTRGEAEEE